MTTAIMNFDLTKRTRNFITFMLKLFLGIIFISPILIALLFSFIPDSQLYELPSFNTIINHFTIDNYIWIFDNIPILRYVTNSLVMSLIVIVAQVLLAAITAYAFAFFDFKGKNKLFGIILVAMMIPSQVTIIANFLTVRNAGLVNTFLGLTLPSMVGCKSIFMMRQSYLTLPRELREATLMDGCGDIRFLVQFAIPLSLPTIASLSIMVFIDIYNAYLWPLLVSRDSSMYTVQIGMSALIGGELPTYGRMFAGAILSILVPVIAFIIGQDYLIKGMTNGAVKG